MSDDINCKYKIAWPNYENIKIVVECSLTVAEWRGFIQHAEKTGGTIARKIADYAKEALIEIDRRKP